MKKVALIIGTRPEVVKMAPVYRALESSRNLEPILVSTGQHRQMLDQALAAVELEANHDLDLMEPGQSLPDLTARILVRVTEVLRDLSPDALLVQGDTTTVFSTAVAAFYAGVPLGHVEAGLRTGNMAAPFPEEMNRRLTSPLAKWHFCPTEQGRANLTREGISPDLCHVTGNTVIDSLIWTRDRNIDRGVTPDAVSEHLGIPAEFRDRFLKSDGRWILVTGHRRESFGGGFERICKALLQLVQEDPDLGVLYPVHLNPQVQDPVNRLLSQNDRICLVEPAGYQDFIWLLDRCTFALSDSGGVQEEAPSLGKPVLVMRDTTERPEGVAAGTCTLVGTDPDRIVREAKILLTNQEEYARRSSLQNPYGDGRSAERIRDIMEVTI